MSTQVCVYIISFLVPIIELKEQRFYFLILLVLRTVKTWVKNRKSHEGTSCTVIEVYMSLETGFLDSVEGNTQY